MHELQIKYARMGLKSDITAIFLYWGLWEMNWYRRPYR